MNKKSSKPPVIVVGMHRSGTSLVSRMLTRAGLYMGFNLDANHEARFFNRYNAWLLSSAGGRWDTPDCMNYLYRDETGVAMAVEYLKEQISSIQTLDYFGLKRFFRYRSLERITEPWGWKDPRNTVTLPLWLQIFPDAKVVHVVRNGVDAAVSLQKRQVQGVKIAEKNYRKHPFLFKIRPKKGWFGTSPRALDLEQAFRIWEEYLNWFERWTEKIEFDCREIRYEDLLSDPVRRFSDLCDFCGLNPPAGKIHEITASIRKDRASAFMNDEKLKAFWETVRKNSPWMTHYGYKAV